MRGILKSLSLIAALVVLSAGACKADTTDTDYLGVTLALSSTTLTVTEGNSLPVNFTVTNNSGASIDVLGEYGWAYQYETTGDASDEILDPGSYHSGGGSVYPTLSTSSDTCGGDLSDGSSCTYSFLLETPSDTGETDGDFGVTPFDSKIDYVWGGVNQGGPEVSFNVTVTDPTPTPTPEPSSLLLLGAGLLGLAPLIRRAAL
jgi:hypothetical protein